MKIHLYSREGLFTVRNYDTVNIRVTTHTRMFTVPVSDYKCMAGGNWNWAVSVKEIDRFERTINPVKYKELEDKCTALKNLVMQQLSIINDVIIDPVEEIRDPDDYEYIQNPDEDAYEHEQERLYDEIQEKWDAEYNDVDLLHKELDKQHDIIAGLEKKIRLMPDILSSSGPIGHSEILRFIVVQDYDTDICTWVFAKTDTSHSTMEEKYMDTINKNVHTWCGGFYIVEGDVLHLSGKSDSFGFDPEVLTYEIVVNPLYDVWKKGKIYYTDKQFFKHTCKFQTMIEL